MVSSIEHVFLYILSFTLMWVWGMANYKKKTTSYWISAILPILIVSLIIGSRVWGADYDNYKYLFINAFNPGLLRGASKSFIYFNQIISTMGFNYVGAFIIYTVLFLISYFYLIRDFKDKSKYMYAFILFSYIGFGTDIIRQAIALSLIIVVISLFEKKKYTLSFIILSIAISFHIATLITVGLLIVIKYFFKKPITPLISIPIYITAIYLGESGAILSQLNPYIQLLNLGGEYQSYIDNSDRWFSGEAFDNQYTQSKFALILNVLYLFSCFYLGFLALKISESKRLIYMYNSTSIGFILFRLFFNIEILRRFFIPLTIFLPIVLGYSIYVIDRNQVKEANWKYANRYLVSLSYIIITIYLILYWGRFIFLNTQTEFFWN